jgi:hypothetical protein
VSFPLDYQGEALSIWRTGISGESLECGHRDREKLICSVSGRLSNLTIKYLAGAENRFFASEDEVRQDADEGKEYGLRTFVPASLTDSDEYWREVATKCFAISAQLGSPTFFLTFTMNPYWLDFGALKRTEGSFSDSAMAAIVFKAKLQGLIKFVQSRRILGQGMTSHNPGNTDSSMLRCRE